MLHALKLRACIRGIEQALTGLLDSASGSMLKSLIDDDWEACACTHEKNSRMRSSR